MMHSNAEPDKLEELLNILEKTAKKGDILKSAITKPANRLFNGDREFFGNILLRLYSSSLFVSLSNPLLATIPLVELGAESLLAGAEAEVGAIDTAVEKIDLALNSVQLAAGFGFIYYGLTQGNEARLLTNIIRGISGDTPIEMTSESGIPYLFYGLTLIKTATGGTLGRYWNERVTPRLKKISSNVHAFFENKTVEYLTKTGKDFAGFAAVTALLYANYTLRGGPSWPVLMSAAMTVMEPTFDISAAVYKKGRSVQVANMIYNNIQYFTGFGLVLSGIAMETLNLINHSLNFIQLLQNKTTYAMPEYQLFSGGALLLGGMLLYAADTSTRKSAPEIQISHEIHKVHAEKDGFEIYKEKLIPYISHPPEVGDEELIREGLELIYHNQNYLHRLLEEVGKNEKVSEHFLDILVEHINEEYQLNGIDLLPIAFTIIRELAPKMNIAHLPRNASEVKSWALQYPEF